MADETKVDAQTIAEAPAKVVEAVAETAATIATAAAKPAKRARVATTRRAKREAVVAPKAATRRAKISRRKTRNSARKTVRVAKQRNETVTNNNFFKGFEAVPAFAPFQSLFADAGERSQEIVRKSQKAAEDLAEITKANVEALTEAGRIAATGARTIGQDAIASGREGIEQASAAVKTLTEAKSPTEFFQLQSELVRASFDRVVAEGSKLTEQFVKLAGEAVQPLSTRASLNAERINELAA